MRNEGVTPEMIERAVQSAVDMKIADTVTLSGDDKHSLRRAFVYEQIHLLEIT
jgi:CMP-N-acetylneuraminic acid synthetase